ncbi:anthranilate synthase component II [Portibacter lacus]|uniref:Aminodeoxychorismate/anthranilate synthase component II n=1 Tax=Portibacter lacus TaxID=1099794 RepID=A0AA37SUV3_9BACT|nr:aminodeoxychorismate/anthranilate synthase component II [Portibacter lacus]GLR19296.1 aminodeoxychorismate/anthranilate synthase component II [Portibacter lacus]
MEKILIIDNYDSFTFNLYQLVKQVSDATVEVFRNDKISVEECDAYDRIILSPGPGLPEEAGNLKAIIKEYADKKPIFGVCLGQQAIGEVFGASLKNLDRVYHGIRTEFKVTEPVSDMFQEMPATFFAGRYHSWVIDKTTLPDDLVITCTDDDGEIMGIAHKNHKIRAVQFHPESIMTEYGKEMMTNFLKL